MSRCFPFPPPGYEKKARTNDVDLLKKEKHREKKHKKEKKDKEKKEGKEKKEKDRADGKHRDKKDKKEKQRDKNKEKEKERDKDKASTSGEKKPGVQSDVQNKETLNSKGKEREKDKSVSLDEKRFSAQFLGFNGLGQNGHCAEETKNLKFVQELGRRIRDEGTGIGHQMVEKLNSTVRKGDESGESLNQNSHLAETKESKFVQELGKRIKDEVAGISGSQIAKKLFGPDRKKDEGFVRLVAMDISNSSEGKEKKMEKRDDGRNTDARGWDEAKHGGNTMVQKLPGLVQGKVEGVPRPVDRKIEKKLEAQEKTKDKENDNREGDKRKDRDREKEKKRDKSKEKKKKKEEKAKERGEQKNTEQDKKESNNADPLGKLLDLRKDSNHIVGSNENPKKRKDLETNGFLHDIDARPNKSPGPSFSHPPMENGRVVGACQTPIKFTYDSSGAVSNNVREINGTAEAPVISIPSAKKSSATAQADQMAVAPSRLPHPDTKYLSRILMIPKAEEWSDFDDQEWLYCGDEAQSKKPKVEPCLGADTPLVWSEALHLKSADVYALPYVIPY